MQLPEPEGRIYYALHFGLLRYADRQLGIIGLPATDAELLSTPPQERVKVRDALFAHPELFEQYLATLDQPPCPDAADLVRGWRDHRVGGTFFVVRHLKKYSVFVSTTRQPRAYGVLALAIPLEVMVPYPPVMVEAVLLPFRGRIIYDGYLSSPGIQLHFGAGAQRSIEDSYREAKARFGIITSLPPSPDTPVADPEQHRHHERGKADARRYGRQLREAGIEEGWFALYQGLIIASARTKADLEARIAEIMPPETAHLPYLYQLKKLKR